MTLDLVTILSLLIGVLGLIATLVGTYFTYISFVNPIVRFKKYLKKTKNWEKFQGIENHISFYRHKKYPNFQIIIDWDKEIVKDFHEEWINDVLYPDKRNNASYQVRLEANSMLLETELFVSLDGHRYFMPVPELLVGEKFDRKFYYSKQQVQLANIIGKHHFGKTIYDFAKEAKTEILIKE